MRLLFAESSTRGYGTEQHIAALATAMVRRGHDVRCLVIAGSPVARPVAGRRGYRRWPFARAAVAAFASPQALLRLAMRQRPDWMVSNDPRFYRMLLAVRRITGARVALFRHWHDAPAKPRTRELLSRRTDRFILVSRFHREEYRRQGMSVEHASVLYNPIDTERFRPSARARASTRARLGFSDSDVVIGYVGRMIEAKGIFTLFDATERFLAADADRAHVVGGRWRGHRSACGRGSRAHRMRAAIGSRPGRPTWRRSIRRSTFSRCRRSIRSPSGASPSRRRRSRVPVVSSLAGGLPETFVADSTGIGVEPGDADALASAILALAARPRAAADGWARPAATGHAPDSPSSASPTDFEQLLAGS